MGEGHSERVERAFSQQAPAFEDPRLNRLFTTDSEWLFKRLALTRDDLVLDVAAGTGHVARQLAPSVRAVVAVDATVAMLEQGRARGVPNVIFLRTTRPRCRSSTRASTLSCRASPCTTSRGRRSSWPRCGAV